MEKMDLSKKERRRPGRAIFSLLRGSSFFGLVVIFIGIVGLILGLGLVFYKAVYWSEASSYGAPSEVRITNLSENSATVSFVTQNQTLASVVFGTYPDLSSASVAFDDRGNNISSSIHHLTLKNLQPGTTYYFCLVSGGKTFDNQGTPYVFSTPKHTGFTPSPPFVIKGRQNPETIVYFSFPSSTSLSTLTSEDGNWLLSLNNVLTKNLERPYPVQKGEKGYLFFQDGKKSLSQEIVVEEEMTIVQNEAKETTEPAALKSELPAPAEVKSPSFLARVLEFLRNLFKNLFG